jgi:tetratricopeptide (TPR) repeat protein
MLPMHQKEIIINVSVSRELSFAYFQLGDFIQANIIDTQLLVIAPDYFQVQNDNSASLVELKRFSEALLHANEAILLNKEYPNPYRWKGKALVGLGRTEEGLEQFKKAILLNPDYKKAITDMRIATKHYQFCLVSTTMITYLFLTGLFKRMNFVDETL